MVAQNQQSLPPLSADCFNSLCNGLLHAIGCLSLLTRNMIAYLAVATKRINGDLLTVRDLSVFYRRGRSREEALRSVSLSVASGERIGIVGGSGCGKTTLARAILGLTPHATGSVRFRGREIPAADSIAMRRYREGAQMLFQDAVGSLNPRRTVSETLCEVLSVNRRAGDPAGVGAMAAALLAQVGLGPETLEAYPRELSGGQCQRVSLARALATDPVLLIADEPVSALDVSVQARVLRLMRDLSVQLHLALIMIAHDLAMVRRICEKVIVLDAGQIVEQGLTEAVLSNPRHPYTCSLLAAVPDIDKALDGRSSRLQGTTSETGTEDHGT